MEAIAFSACTFVSTLLGGFFAFRFRERLHIILSFTAGVILGVVSFEIFPEIIAQVHQNHLDPKQIMAAFAAAFLIFHVLEKLAAIHPAHEEEYAHHRHPKVGILSALALIGHSFMDGVSIGLGFRINHAVGIAVSIAVVSHDFSDGMNTVALMLGHENSAQRARIFLVLDAAAPLAGALLSLAWPASPHFLAIYLGIFAGFLLYIGGMDILPEAHSEHGWGWGFLVTVFGVTFTYLLSCWI